MEGGGRMARARPALQQRAAAAVAPATGLDDASDEDLAGRGDAEGFKWLYRRHLPAVYRYAYARTGNRQDAEDLTALVFERAWANLPHYRATGPFRGWLFTIARRAAIDRRRRHRPDTVPVEALAEVLPDSAGGPEAAALTAEELRQILRLLDELRPEQRDVLGLRFFAGLQYAEIARVVGKREPAVKMLAYRALDTLRRRFDDERIEG